MGGSSSKSANKHPPTPFEVRTNVDSEAVEMLMGDLRTLGKMNRDQLFCLIGLLDNSMKNAYLRKETASAPPTQDRNPRCFTCGNSNCIYKLMPCLHKCVCRGCWMLPADRDALLKRCPVCGMAVLSIERVASTWFCNAAV